MALLTKSTAAKVLEGIRTESVSVPEWGEGAEVLVRELTTTQITELGVTASKLEGLEGFADDVVDITAVTRLFPTIVAWTAVDENLEPLWTIAEVEKMPGSAFPAIERIGTKALELTGLTEEMEPEEPDPK